MPQSPCCEGGLQRYPDHGHPRACILRLFRLPCYQLLWRVLQVRGQPRNNELEYTRSEGRRDIVANEAVVTKRKMDQLRLQSMYPILLCFRALALQCKETRPVFVLHLTLVWHAPRVGTPDGL
eukprot:scaffold47790_cov16-Tisochrysis_lutea.AAC.4